MSFRLPSCILLVAILLQGAFGGLASRMVICLGGEHECAPTEAIEECQHAHDHQHACSHHHEWAAPVTTHDHHDHHGHNDHDDHCCTDVELALVVLLITPRVNDQEVELPPALPSALLSLQKQDLLIPQGQQHPIWHEDPGGALHRAMIRSTRLLI